MDPQSALYLRPAELLQNLIRFDTTNPPGNEAACIAYVEALLAQAGFETRLLARDRNRPNLVARLAGRGDAPALLLQGHVDVVTTEHQEWQHPPFAGELVDGYVWGRGALDMKGGVAMMLAAAMRAKAEGLDLPGDIVLAILADEEAGGAYGAKFLVENHADLFQGIRYAIGEMGGYSLYLGGRKFYPIMVAEKKVCWMKATLRGPGGHGSIPISGGAMAKLARMLDTLDKNRLPVKITPVVREMVQAMAAALPDPTASSMHALLDPATTDAALAELGPAGRIFQPIVRNTVNATIVHGGEKINVIPGEIVVQMDGRLLPGDTSNDMIAQLRDLIGNEPELELIDYDPFNAEPDMSMFDTLSGILRETDPDAVPVPFLLSGFTDGRHFARLGIQTYGFLPMDLPQGFNSTQTIHAADERIPAEAVEFGANAIYKLLQRFGDRS